MSPDGAFAAYATGSTVHLQDVSNEETEELSVSGRVSDLAFSPNSQFLAAATGQRPAVWRVKTRKAIVVSSNSKELAGARTMAFSSDSTLLAVGHRTGVDFFFYELPSGQRTPVQTPGAEVKALQFCPDGSVIAIVEESAVRLWSLTQERDIFDYPVEQPLVIGFSPCGTYFAMYDRYEPIRVWQGWHSGAPVEVARVNWTETVRSICFSPDGRYLWSATQEPFIKRNALPTQLLIDEAKARLPRPLTREEWARFLPSEAYEPVLKQ